MRLWHLVVILGLVGCSSDPSSGLEFTAVINGDRWTAGRGAGTSEPSAVLYTGNQSVALFGIATSGNNTFQLTVICGPITMKGTFILGDTASGCSARYDEDFGLIGAPGHVHLTYFTAASTPGEFKVSEFGSGTVGGSFDFTAHSVTSNATATAVGGRFTLDLQELPGSPAARFPGGPGRGGSDLTGP